MRNFTVRVYCPKCRIRHVFKVSAEILAEAKEIANLQVQECPGPKKEEEDEE